MMIKIKERPIFAAEQCPRPRPRRPGFRRNASLTLVLFSLLAWAVLIGIVAAPVLLVSR